MKADMTAHGGCGSHDEYPSEVRTIRAINEYPVRRVACSSKFWVWAPRFSFALVAAGFPRLLSVNSHP